MAKSLAKIQEQIARLQKEADSIQSTVIARIKREIAQYGLTAEHLFRSTDSTFVGNGNKANAKSRKAPSAGAAKPAKYADDQGNTWHGIGKRPSWIHDALNAGRTLTDFLVGAKKAAPAAKAPRAAVKTPRKATKKTARKIAGKAAQLKEVMPARKAAKAPTVAKPARKAPAGKRSAAPTNNAAVKRSPTAKAAAASADAGQVLT